jgi:hypothetical protein
LLWYYLLLWGWAVNGLMLIAVVWTLVLAAKELVPSSQWHRFTVVAGPGLGAVIVGVTALFAVEASGVQQPTPPLAEQLRAVVSPTVRALDDHVGPADGRSGRYLVTFFDPNSLGSQGFGLINELERSRFHVGTLAGFRSEVGPHRVLSSAQVTAVVHLAVGSDIATWRAKPDSFEVAYSDPRSPKQRAEYDRLHSEAIAELQAAGRSDEVSQVDQNLIGLSLNQSLPATIQHQLSRMDNLGLPIAVFVAAPNDQY